jgi:large subunit ribosomal protein L29
MANIVELREFPNEVLLDMLEDRREELFNLRFQKATGRLEDYSRLAKVRQDIAQILTLVNARNMAIDQALQDKTVAGAVAGKEVDAVARFDYELSRYVVQFFEGDNEVAMAHVDINKKRRGMREARKRRKTIQRVTQVEVAGS